MYGYFVILMNHINTSLINHAKFSKIILLRMYGSKLLLVSSGLYGSLIFSNDIKWWHELFCSLNVDRP